MPTMHLHHHLLNRITVAALLCLLLAMCYTLFHAHREANAIRLQTAAHLSAQLQYQLLRIKSGLGQANPFPDFALWDNSAQQTGVCVSYIPRLGTESRSNCHGEQTLAPAYPQLFAELYRTMFTEHEPVRQIVQLNGVDYGTLIVTRSSTEEISAAWQQISAMLPLSAITVISVCLLVSLTVNRALQPARIIVAGINRMANAQDDYRLPGFALHEWQCIAEAINCLTAGQQQLTAERRQLIAKLLAVQEDERKLVSRELHDELGQCLVAINAVAASVKLSAAQQCPDLVAEAEQINRIAAQALTGIRNMLERLRPAELDELGLTVGLERLIAAWNQHGKAKTRYTLQIEGDYRQLTAEHTIALFRIAQEGLTNISKHAAATDASIILSIHADEAALTIKDNGVLTALPFLYSRGFGLLGMRERVNALNGEFKLELAVPHGLIVNVTLPLPNTTGSS